MGGSSTPLEREELERRFPRAPSGALRPLPQAWPSSNAGTGAREQSASVLRPVAPSCAEALAELCHFCFCVLVSHLRGEPEPPFPQVFDPLFRAPLFVTWLKKQQHSSKGEEQLRGCIGCLEPIAFVTGLAEYVLRSSQQDRRFPPVALEEVPLLSCRLSILTEFEPCPVYDWVVGLHGVSINFTDTRNKRYSATYLPEVAREYRMSQETAIRELVVKSGYSGQCDDDLLSRMQCTRYQTKVVSASYAEFLRRRTLTP